MAAFNPLIQLKLEEYFSENGLLATKYGLKRRHSQANMVSTICSALSQGKGAFIEAPTGTGKSLAYLFVAAEFIAHLSDKGLKPKVIISTASKGLQDQLASKDLPFLSKIYPALNYFAWKGANNYICLNRLTRFAHSKASTPKLANEAKQLLQHQTQLTQLVHGLREELPMGISDELWAEISGATPCCTKLEPLTCYKRRAYAHAEKADILCINHTFLAFMGLYTPFVHPAQPSEDELLYIVDEGHELLTQLRGALNRNFSLAQLKRLIGSIQDKLTQTTLSTKLDQIIAHLSQQLASPIIHVQPQHTEAVSQLRLLAAVMFQIASELKKDFEWLNEAGMYLDEVDKLEAQANYKSLFTNAEYLLNFLDRFPADTMLELSMDYQRKQRLNRLRITYKPFTYDQQLSHIYSYSAHPPIITSATLINGPSHQILQHYCLSPENMVVHQIPGEYDYLNTVRGFVFPDIQSPGDPATIVHWLKHILPVSHGNALILFTNRQTMEQSFSDLYIWGQQLGYNMIIQNENQTPNQLSSIMKAQPNTVLFGLKSLWTGIDIKGANLSSLIITRLPFDAPDPYTDAYSTFLRTKGYHPFWEWALPEMINRFRQGIGRLKRDADDKGLIFILDPRFLTARYKPHMLGRLPLMSWDQVRTPADLPPLANWLGVVDPLKKPAA